VCKAEGIEPGDRLRAIAEACDAPSAAHLLDFPLIYLREYLDEPVARRDAQRLPSEASLAGYQSRLWCEREALAYLKGRGLYSRTIRRHGLGYDVDKHAIVIPVYADDELVNVRLRFLSPRPKQPKYIGLRGRPGQLYPAPPAAGYVVLCAGEFDALLTIQHGIPAVTSTIGAGSWKSEWDQHFAGRRVAVVFDVNEYDAAAKRAEALSVVCDAWPVNLRALLSDGKDLTDYFTCDGTAQELTEHIRTERGRA